MFSEYNHFDVRLCWFRCRFWRSNWMQGECTRCSGIKNSFNSTIHPTSDKSMLSLLAFMPMNTCGICSIIWFKHHHVDRHFQAQIPFQWLISGNALLLFFLFCSVLSLNDLLSNIAIISFWFDLVLCICVCVWIQLEFRYFF